MFDIASAMIESGVSVHEKCSIYGSNCAQWMIAMQVPSSPLHLYISRLTRPALHSLSIYPLSNLSCLCAWHAMLSLKGWLPLQQAELCSASSSSALARP